MASANLVPAEWAHGQYDSYVLSRSGHMSAGLYIQQDLPLQRARVTSQMTSNFSAAEIWAQALVQYASSFLIPSRRWIPMLFSNALLRCTEAFIFVRRPKEFIIYITHGTQQYLHILRYYIACMGLQIFAIVCFHRVLQVADSERRQKLSL